MEDHARPLCGFHDGFPPGSCGERRGVTTVSRRTDTSIGLAGIDLYDDPLIQALASGHKVQTPEEDAVGTPCRP